MAELGSNKDRHANLGKGKIGEKGIYNILHRKEFKTIPFILETPALKTFSTAEEEISQLKKLAE